MKRDEFLAQVEVTKLVHGGQGLGVLPDGRKVFVWNALPGEIVRMQLLKRKRSYAEGIAAEIIQSSPERIAPREDNYLATSPWQILTFEAENRYKLDIAREVFEHHKMVLPRDVRVTHDERVWAYRNKMEYSFWGDESGLHLALHGRGSHAKEVVTGSALAMAAIDKAANNLCALLGKMSVRAGELKTIIVRCSQTGRAVGSLFVKSEEFPKLGLPSGLGGLRVYYSNPKSPASVATKLLYEFGDCELEDGLLGKSFAYDVDSFFQVNVPVFELALQRIKEHCELEEVTDIYAGVGSIGLSVAKRGVDLIELDPATARMARVNAESSGLRATVIEASTEKALEYIRGDRPVVFDPPRAGLHDKVVRRLLEVRPSKIVYLSCNPATQARDLVKLRHMYRPTYFEVFNFFPRTPHIETLAVLDLYRG